MVPFIECRDVIKIYQLKNELIKISVLKGINLSLQKGSLNAILGPSGSGKSTLMRIIGGFDSTSAGFIRVGDFILSEMTAPQLDNYRRKYIGFLNQIPEQNIIPALSTLRNILVAMQVKDYSRNLRIQKAEELLDLVDLGARKTITAGKLSGGEMQRLGIAISLSCDPLLILADEPTGELDSDTTKKIIELFHELNKNLSQTFIIATHDDRLAKHCDSFRILNGRIVSATLGYTKTFQSELHYNELIVMDQTGTLTIPKGKFNQFGENTFLRMSYNSELECLEIHPPTHEVGVFPIPTLQSILNEGSDQLGMKKHETVVILRNISKTFFTPNITIPVLTNLNLQIYKNSFNVIMGPSGSGKSTLLSIIAGLDNPTNGEVILSGTKINDLNEEHLVEIRRNKISIIFQFFNLHPSLTVSENIELPMLFAGRESKFRRKRVNELLDLVGLQDRANHKPHELSGGEKQRVGIARALANNPEIILADEPTGNLDSLMAIQIMNLFIRLNQNPYNKTIIMVTHDEHLLSPNMRVLKLADGNIVSDEIW